MLPAFSQPCVLISVVGGGGKTSLIQWLAEYYAEQGKRVVVAPSTKICADDVTPIVLASEHADLVQATRQCLQQNVIVTLCAEADSENNKYKGLDVSIISHLKQLQVADIILCEADGARHKPLKAPNAQEPVIVPQTDVYVGVVGLDALYKPLQADYVHRTEIFSKLVDLPLGQRVEFSHIVRLAQAEDGLFKNCPENCHKLLFLNKFDVLNDVSCLEAWREELKASLPKLACWCGSVQGRKLFALSGE